MVNFIGGALLIRFVDIVLIKDIFKCHLATENTYIYSYILSNL